MVVKDELNKKPDEKKHKLKLFHVSKQLPFCYVARLRSPHSYAGDRPNQNQYHDSSPSTVSDREFIKSHFILYCRDYKI